MKTEIYYFSGTGNSLNIAKSVKSRLPKSTILPIIKFLEKDRVKISADKVIFIFPTYYLKLPDIVEKFIKKIIFTKDPYIAFIATCGGDAGFSLNHMDLLLKEKKTYLNAGFMIDMVDNSLGFTAAEEEKQKKLNKEVDFVEKIIKKIENNRENNFIKKTTFFNIIHEKALKIIYRKFMGADLKKCNKKECVKCKICEKVCPVNNISFEKDYPKWSKKCVECSACINFCPQKAIFFGIVNPKGKGQYNHPNINLNEIMNQKIS